MKANPGAPVPPDQVVGSNELISDLWDRLEQQSLVLTAERRIGKTLIIQKMKAEPREGKLTVFHDLEHVRTPIEFASAIFQDIEQYLSRSGQSAQRVRKLIKNVAGAELEGLGVRLKLPAIAASHWKEVIIQTFEDLVDHQGESVQAILFWDEVPWMLQEIAHTVGQDGATEVLDTLRSIRQTFPSVRMVFTGSVGLHHVRDRFRDSGYTNPSTNDMYVVDVPPLKVDDATELACQLLLGEHVAIKGSEDPLSIATAVAESVDSIPYYIHHLVVRLKSLHQPIDTMTVEREVNQACTDPQDQWQLQHYQTRLKSYYRQADQYDYALNLLDILAAESGSLDLNDLVNQLQIILNKQADWELVRTVLRLLQKDHYLLQDQKSYYFRFRLIQRYWSLSRG